MFAFFTGLQPKRFRSAARDDGGKSEPNHDDGEEEDHHGNPSRR
jgi:hypothetical protein